MRVIEKDGSSYIQSRFSRIYEIDLEGKTFSFVENSGADDFEWKTENALKYSFFAGEYDIEAPDGYDGVVKYIKSCELECRGSVVDACGYLDNGILKGFVQVYKDTSGVHGNYSIEKISHSLIFAYDAEADDFSVLNQFDDVVVVAVHDDTIIYWKDRAYYSYDIKMQTETYLVEDKAYDAGLTQYSTPAVLANENMCVLHLVKGKTNGYVEYMYVFDFLSNKFFELKWQE